MAKGIGMPEDRGLYSSKNEKDNCGVGFIAQMEGKANNQTVKKGLNILKRLEHRGAVGADPETGDGAGLLIQQPDEFFRSELNKQGISLPEFDDYAVGMIFLPQEKKEQKLIQDIIEKKLAAYDTELITWRDVAVAEDKIGENAASTLPEIKQLFIKNQALAKDFALNLYFIRRAIEKEIKASNIKNKDYFHISSFSEQTIVYKGLLLAEQIEEFYLDLQANVKSQFALVHQRYSTNTFPSWDLAQPFRYLAHNGEINTLQGNINWMSAREPDLCSETIGEKIKQLFPINNRAESDSANLDHALELMLASGMELTEAITMLIPEAWQRNNELEQSVKDYYEYNATLIEPWDGPAAVAFTDGKKIGATVDRNGLRPLRYLVTEGKELVVASEVGGLEIAAKEIKKSGKLKPGEIIALDLESGELKNNNQIKKSLSQQQPYNKWLEKKQHLNQFSAVESRYDNNFESIFNRLKIFAYDREELKLILAAMAKNKKEPIGSMGNDTPLAVLSNQNKVLFNYFKQLFAQVTNPPIDPIREELVMSLKSSLGCKANLLKKTADKAKVIELDTPILKNSDLDKILALDNESFKASEVKMLFEVEEQSLEEGLNSLLKKVETEIEQGNNIIVLSDRGVNKDKTKAPIPSLLATSAVHNHLIEVGKRNGVDLIIETGEAREVMHFALLIGYGALAINPYLAFESIEYLAEKEIYLKETEDKNLVSNYIKAINKGLLKIMSKMGISTIQSYRGAQIFEAVGLAKDFVKQYFPGTASRIGGADIEVIEKEVLINYYQAKESEQVVNQNKLLAHSGEYSWRKNGEHHLFNPNTITKLQQATRQGDYQLYQEYADLVNQQSGNLATIRALLEFTQQEPIPIEEVETVEEIRKRFMTGAMSFGSLSKEAHETLAQAMNQIGGMSNSGEGGEDSARYGTDKNSAVKQIASGRFGVTTEYMSNADELQIKIAQGAKPGEGGHLPGHKVSQAIADVRHTTPGIDLISPPPHHDIYSIEDLAQLIFDLKNVNPASRTSVKLVSEVGIGTIAAGVAKAHADMILVSGFDGGTGAAPLTSIKHTGLPWELGLSETHQVLVENNLRGRVRVQTDGQMKTGRDVAIAALLGAEEFGFATAPLVVLGCVMMRCCHSNTCPVGIATQDKELRDRFSGQVDYIVNYFNFVAQELREIMAELGFKTVDEMIGQTNKLKLKEENTHWKSEGIDLSQLLFKPETPKGGSRYFSKQGSDITADVLDRKLIEATKPAWQNKKEITIKQEIKNINRSTGAMLSGKIAKLYGEQGLADDTIKLEFEGYAGQSFAMGGMKGITFELTGQANDYVGKALSGAKVIIKPGLESSYQAESNIIAGNTILYGATSGELYINGCVGERFAVRNSGAKAVVEAIGDHGCEYMTGGRIVILGEIGRNFAAGMSGGIAYIYSSEQKLDTKINFAMVEREDEITSDELAEIKEMLIKHVNYTASKKGEEILANWEEEAEKFVKIIPSEYKKIIEKGD